MPAVTIRLFRLAYEAILWVALLVTLPASLTWLAFSPKTRAGFWFKLGFWPSNFKERLRQLQPATQVQRIWFHAVSVGEFNAILPLITDLHGQNITLFVSVTTATAYALAQQRLPQSVVLLYFPFDLAWVQCQALKQIQPHLLILTETELWPNLLFEAKAYGCPVWLINGRLSDKSFKRYRAFSWLLTKPMLSQLTYASMQSEEDARRLRELGLPAKRIQVLGNIKFDTHFKVDEAKVQAFKHLLGLSPTDWLLTVASTHDGEEAMAVDLFTRLKASFPSLKLVLAPRHPHRCDAVRKMLSGRSLRYSLRTELTEALPNTHPIVVLDTIGELLPVYALSQATILGGSFVPVGGHNLLEPLGLQAPVIFGPYMFNFKEMTALVLSYGAGKQVDSLEQAEQTLISWITQPEQLCQKVEAGQQLIDAHRGAKERLLKKINACLLP
jgi:3-deoxy-D-manno-octulosonic-acid transferase